MSLTPQTSRELEQLAKEMLEKGVGQMPYRSFGTLVRQNSPEFTQFEGVVAFAQFKIGTEVFIYFAN